jgi:hypothetical protein
MSLMNRVLRPAGDLQIRHIRAPKSPIAWRVRNALRWSWLKGWIAYHLIAPFASWWGVMTAIATLEAKLIKADGTVIDYGILSYRVITDAGVAYIVDDWDGGADDINELDFHGCGTGTNAEAAADTALQTESTTALNPNSTRASGVNSQPAANQFRSTGTLAFDGSAAITEHGIFDQAATGGGTLFDRSVFSAINVVSGDSIAFQYTLTLTAGG